MPCSTCEAVSQSEHLGSPGPVADGESLYRQIFLPDQLNEDGTVKPTALRKDDFQGGRPPPRGVSVDRAGHTAVATMVANAEEQVGRMPTRTGFKTFTCGAAELRSLDIDDQRIVCVVDRALPHNVGHAEIWGAIVSKPAALKAIRYLVAQSLQPCELEAA